jgi:methyl-accepting chemotaxis protein
MSRVLRTVARARDAFEQIGKAVEDMSARVAEIHSAVTQISPRPRRPESRSLVSGAVDQHTVEITAGNGGRYVGFRGSLEQGTIVLKQPKTRS